MTSFPIEPGKAKLVVLPCGMTDHQAEHLVWLDLARHFAVGDDIAYAVDVLDLAPSLRRCHEKQITRHQSATAARQLAGADPHPRVGREKRPVIDFFDLSPDKVRPV
jgi:hypothetical protein